MGVESSDTKFVQHTERECHNCEDGHYVKDEYDLYCPECFFCPDGSTRRSVDEGVWEWWRKKQQRADENGDRVYMVGGHPSAYVGDEEYEYTRTGGFNDSF